MSGENGQVKKHQHIARDFVHLGICISVLQEQQADKLLDIG
jgi:hydrogenase maturation factor